MSFMGLKGQKRRRQCWEDFKEEIIKLRPKKKKNLGIGGGATGSRKKCKT